MVVFQDAIWDRLDAAADCLFALCCAEADRLSGLVSGLLGPGSAAWPALAAPGPAADASRGRLGAAFERLLTLNGLRLDYTRAMRLVFRKNMKLFATEARAFMRVN